MRSIKTYETILKDKFSVSDYPACKLFYPFNEASTTTVPTDLVLGITHTVTLGGFTFDGTKGTATAPATSLTGTLAGPNLGSTKDFVAIAIVDQPTNNDSLKLDAGSAANLLEFKRNDAAGASRVLDTNGDTTLFSGQTDIDANTEVIVMYSDRGNVLGGGADHYLAESDGAAIANAEGILIAGAADAAIDLSADLLDISATAGVVCYGIAIFLFTTLPTDVLSGASWMNYQWRQGNKVLYPGWKNKT